MTPPPHRFSLEFKSNPIFKQQLDMDRAGGNAAGGIGGGGGGDVSPRGGMAQGTSAWQGNAAEANVMTF